MKASTRYCIVLSLEIFNNVVTVFDGSPCFDGCSALKKNPAEKYQQDFYVDCHISWILHPHDEVLHAMSHRVLLQR